MSWRWHQAISQHRSGSHNGLSASYETAKNTLQVGFRVLSSLVLTHHADRVNRPDCLFNSNICAKVPGQFATWRGPLPYFCHGCGEENANDAIVCSDSFRGWRCRYSSYPSCKADGCKGIPLVNMIRHPNISSFTTDLRDSRQRGQKKVFGRHV